MTSPARSDFNVSFEQIEYVDSIVVSLFEKSPKMYDHECCTVDPVRPGSRIF